ncbi:hypothetical protein [Mariniblastus fucicola]|uniref:Uncharacterized protein n=1 Tax=Mariniblastus fucicola TaxID=980251 RepID=A0A5B9P8G5_9BACT|nr:hypothetical protein [Mariniblastus fucicola]QEG21809.1 hypothetical protein MFFC18_16680 [Mariniblastus fucicola]
MPYHVPFEHRRRPQPVYIGFDVPQRPRRKFNWWGFWGLLMSLGSFLTAGFASPLSLLVSLNGMRKKKGPRKAATAGTVFSLMGILLAGSIVTFAVNEEHAHRQKRMERKLQREVAAQVEETQVAIAIAERELDEFRGETGYLPTGIDGNMLMLKHTDAWGKEIRYDAEASPALLRSAGPDQTYNTDDDVTSEVEGEVDSSGAIEVQ